MIFTRTNNSEFQHHIQTKQTNNLIYCTLHVEQKNGVSLPKKSQVQMQLTSWSSKLPWFFPVKRWRLAQQSPCLWDLLPTWFVPCPSQSVQRLGNYRVFEWNSVKNILKSGKFRSRMISLILSIYGFFPYLPQELKDTVWNDRKTNLFIWLMGTVLDSM